MYKYDHVRRSMGLNITIEEIKFSDLTPIKEAVERENMKLVNTRNTTWFGARTTENWWELPLSRKKRCHII